MTILEIKERISPILKKYDVKYAGVCGSHARGQATEKSDVDLIVRLRRPVGFIKLGNLEQTLQHELQKPIDLVEEEAVSKYMKPYIF